MQLDIDRLIAYFGGVNALSEALRKLDPEHAVSTAAIYKWRTRASLPLAQLQKLSALAEAQGRPLDLNAFMHHQTTLEKPAMSQTNQVIIFDTTLRDGEQSPGAAMTKEKKSGLPANWKNWAWMSSRQVSPPPARVILKPSMKSPNRSPVQRFVRWHAPSSAISALPVKRCRLPPTAVSIPLSLPAPSIWSTS